jgi:hypothetical protein
MSFKFKLGTVVQKIEDPSGGQFRVIGLLLSDRINIRDLDKHSASIVEAKDYEEVEEKDSSPDY